MGLLTKNMSLPDIAVLINYLWTKLSNWLWPKNLKIPADSSPAI